MSFMGGSACAQGANPLAQMAKQQHFDKSLQHDRMGGQQQHQQMRNQRQMASTDQQMLQQMNSQKAFNFDDLRAELPHSGGGSAWAQEMRSSPQPMAQHQPQQLSQAAGPAPAEWATEFGRHGSPGVVSGPAPQMHGASMGGMRYTPMFSGGMQRMQPQHTQAAQQHQENKIVELDDASWEQQFKSIESQQSTVESDEAKEQTKSEEGNTVEVPVEDLEDEPVYSIENGYDPKWFEKNNYPPDWDDVWDRIKDQLHDDGEAHMRAGGDIWERDFQSFASSRPSYADYKFAQDNPYMKEEDPYALGVALMDQGAKLSLAALAFEAAIQRNKNHVDAWCRLGLAQSQNEMENESICALEQCVKLDKNNQQALLNLAISYTNEGYENAAFATLERWLATKYPDLVNQATSENPSLASENRMELHERVTGLFIKAAQMSPDGANIDADVQVGLGVLFYGNEQYSKAVDCFRAALEVRPDDPLMWNRLGATLANSNKPEEAIEAYYKALELRPSFVRARYNIGISCINIGCYQEAAEHLLSGMWLHQTDEGDGIESSSNLSDTLRRVLLAMDRRDLVPLVGPGMDFGVFRQHFNF